ncbi:MAG: type IX secretion system outer membrane channel protein PorV [Bacteroidales bacterium]|nr:type IX secretion system outer membrane channel protein PorV [Bacteroidales bacterium]MDD2570740.1 type IX secretion system outer membrane channel protein PorV [Bacteroidales bacterium]MDD2812193.1 type IX secretion system outer membrane channel protein PorV [Bacteroidales bacterium]MDD3385242.1 type IX secretion system outer membrane channel protein PorV [Bacteroidales bacterium]MDD3811420.1 type IX secretion system outer membrane channel protein PorV [Bacteroidales bacterium]
MKVILKSGITLLISMLLTWTASAQISTDELSGKINTVTSAVPFLTIAPDSRSGGMGDVGVALSPDANSMHWNPAKYAFAPNDMGISISYTPWLRKLIKDINLAYLSGYKRIDNEQVIGFSLRYFALGDIAFTDIVGNPTGNYNPNEFTFDAAYARAFSDRFSGSLAFRFIYSNLTGGQFVGGVESTPGMAYSSDVSFYYRNSDLILGDYDGTIAFGANISNIGSKMGYTKGSDKDFIPINLRLGTAFTIDFDDYNSLTLALDLNKLMIPTPPEYYPLSDTADLEGNPVIRAGYNPNVSVPVGMFRSFYDAPGGMIEELNEITYSAGLEYWYAKQFAIRGGYFHEHSTKGNRKYFTVGIGLRLNVFGLDFAYLVPIYQNHPLANTLRFSLLFDFAGLKGERR